MNIIYCDYKGVLGNSLTLDGVTGCKTFEKPCSSLCVFPSLATIKWRFEICTLCGFTVICCSWHASSVCLKHFSWNLDTGTCALSPDVGMSSAYIAQALHWRTHTHSSTMTVMHCINQHSWQSELIYCTASKDPFYYSVSRIHVKSLTGCRQQVFLSIRAMISCTKSISEIFSSIQCPTCINRHPAFWKSDAFQSKTNSA